MNINIDFPLILTSVVCICGFITLLDILFFAPKRRKNGVQMGKTIENARSFFPVLLIVLLIRSFIVQPYKVPTGSLEPTILPGDFIVVNQFTYGLRLPVLNKKIMQIGEPKTGDIALFRYPANPSINFVKRIIGLPGDHIIYKNKQLTINGKVIDQEYLGMDLDQEYSIPFPVTVKQENLNQVKHKIFINDQATSDNHDVDLVVPQGNYFVMGDNRDNSNDSRYWGFVPEENLIGKGVFIWFSWDSQHKTIRWNRIGNKLQ